MKNGLIEIFEERNPFEKNSDYLLSLTFINGWDSKYLRITEDAKFEIFINRSNKISTFCPSDLFELIGQFLNMDFCNNISENYEHSKVICTFFEFGNFYYKFNQNYITKNVFIESASLLKTSNGFTTKEEELLFDLTENLIEMSKICSQEKFLDKMFLEKYLHKDFEAFFGKKQKLRRKRK